MSTTSMSRQFDTLIESQRDQIPLGLVRAVIWKESSFDPYAIRFEPNYKWLYKPERFASRLGLTVSTEVTQQKWSWGLMQVMGALARELGFDEKFLSKLCDPETGIEMGCLQLNKLWTKYKGDERSVLAAYNGGAGAVDRSGNHRNLHTYVIPVLARVNDL